MPVMTLSKAPMISVFFLPNLSALVVSISETMISPKMTANCMIPISCPVKFLSYKFLIMTMAIIPYENIRKALAINSKRKSVFFLDKSRVISYVPVGSGELIIQLKDIYLLIYRFGLLIELFIWDLRCDFKGCVIYFGCYGN